jgi:hypothetical protein
LEFKKYTQRTSHTQHEPGFEHLIQAKSGGVVFIFIPSEIKALGGPQHRNSSTSWQIAQASKSKADANQKFKFT